MPRVHRRTVPLRKAGVPHGKIIISDRAQLVMSYHMALGDSHERGKACGALVWFDKAGNRTVLLQRMPRLIFRLLRISMRARKSLMSD